MRKILFLLSALIMATTYAGEGSVHGKQLDGDGTVHHGDGVVYDEKGSEGQNEALGDGTVHGSPR